jgi:hypothetical protein
MKDAKRVAREFHETFTPTRVASTGFEVIENLTSTTNTASVLSAVADWHKHPRRRGARHAEIAARVFTAAMFADTRRAA